MSKLLSVSLIALITLSSLAALRPAQGQTETGSVLRQIYVPIVITQGTHFPTIGLAFDGSSLYYSAGFENAGGDTRIIKIDTNGNLLQIIQTNPGTPLGGLAWDGSELWGGIINDNWQPPYAVYTVDPSTGTTTQQFTTSGLSQDFPGIDGLGYDQSTDTLWLGLNYGNHVYQLSRSGELLRTISTTFPTSGVEFDGQYVWVVDPTTHTLHQFKTDGTEVSSILAFDLFHEDLAYDPVTFAPQCALWSMEAYAPTANPSTGQPANRVTATEIPCTNTQPVLVRHYFTNMSGNVIPQPLLGQQYHLVLVVKNPDSVKHTYNIYVKQHSASPKVGAPGWPGWETAILGLPSEWQVNPRCTGASADFLGNLCGTKPQQVALEPSASTAITYTFTDWWDWIPPWDWTILAAEVLQVILLAHVGPLKALAFSGIEEGLGASYFILNEEFQFNLFSNRTMFESFPQGMGVPVSKIDAYTASFVLSLGAGGITTACLTGLACPPALISQAILIGMQYGTYKFAEDADSNYTTVVVPRPLTLNNGTALMNLPAVSLAPDRWKTLIETLAEAASFHNATMISAERYFGALEVGSQSFADLQLEAVAKYSTARDEALAVFDTQFSSLAYQIPALNSTIVQLSHDYLTRNGLPPVERQILSGLGLSESIDALSAGLMAFNTTTLNVVSLPDSIHLLRQTFVSQTNSWDNQAALSGEGISVSSFYTDGNGNQVNDDAQGNPKVDVVIANDLVRSTNPGQILAWVNLTNSAEGQYQSISINETLPLDWSISPPLASAHGSTKVYFANTTSLSSNLEITEPTTITVSTDNPEMIRLSIPSLNATAIGHPLMAGQTILLSVKMDYVLTGTTQLPKSYARYYSDIANAAVWTQTSYSGSKAMAIGSAFFKAYAKIQGESVPPLTILGLQPIVFYVIVGIAVVAAGAASVVVLRREDLLRSCRHKRILASREGPVGPQ